MTPLIKCVTCKNYIGNQKCKAFNKIPEKILTGIKDHTKPIQNQGNSIVFELAK